MGNGIPYFDNFFMVICYLFYINKINTLSSYYNKIIYLNTRVHKKNYLSYKFYLFVNTLQFLIFLILFLLYNLTLYIYGRDHISVMYKFLFSVDEDFCLIAFSNHIDL